jgi:hypothetical protein
MKYREILAGLFRRHPEMDQGQYADYVGLRREHLSAILNGREPGSLKTVQQALRADGLDIENCLHLPGEYEAVNDDLEKELVEKLLFILRQDARRREGITVNIEDIHERAQQEFGKRGKARKSPASLPVERPPPAEAQPRKRRGA